MNTAPTRLQRLTGYWRQAERFVLGFSMIAISVLVVGNVFSRQFFGNTWAFTQELGGLLLIIITFGGLSYAAELRRHINMSAVHDMLPDRAQAILTGVIEIVTAVLMFVMSYISLRYVVQIYGSGDVTSVLQIPMFIPLAIIPLVFLLTGVRYLTSFFGNEPYRPDDSTSTSSDNSLAQE